MSCHEWEALLAHRFVAGAEPPTAFRRVETHLETCPACRAAAAEVDPTTAFRGAAEWTPSAEDAAAILQGVRTLRRAGALGARAGEARVAAEPSARHRVAAAGLFVLLLALLPGSAGRQRIESPNLSRMAVTPRAARAAVPPPSALDGLDRPQARVYEWGGDDLSVVMVVDESLDV